jgi:hypothetical protein
VRNCEHKFGRGAVCNNCGYSMGYLLIREENETSRLRKALESIAKNTCCDRCQEAALVAIAALGGGK